MESRQLPLTFGILAVIAGLVVTFVQNHSAQFGLIVFGAWALVTGVATLVQSVVGRGMRLGPWRTTGWVLTIIAGVAALLLAPSPAVFAVLTGIWAVLFGAAQFLAWRVRAHSDIPVSEGRFVALVSLGLGALQLLMPANSVVNLGVLGAYWVVVGSWLIIGALSPRAVPNQGSTE